MGADDNRIVGITDRDLNEQRERLRQKLPAKELEDGWISQAALVRCLIDAGVTKSPDIGGVRGTLRGLIKHGMRPTPPPGPMRGRNYSIDDALDIGVGCWLNKTKGVTPRGAARRLLPVREARVTAGGPPVVVGAADTAFERVRNFIVARVVRAVLTNALGASRLPTGTVVHVSKRVGVGADSHLILEGLVPAPDEIEFLDRVPDPPSHWPRRAVLLPAGNPRYVIDLQSPTVLDEASGRADGPAFSEASAAKLLDVVIDGIAALRGKVIKKIAERPNAPEPLPEDIGLWLFCKLGCRILSPDDHTEARCMIFAPDSGIDAAYVVHREIASSFRAPWEYSTGREASVPFGQLCVGYAYAVNMTLALGRTYAPYNLLVTDYRFETKSVKRDEISCVAIPIQVLGFPPVAVLYAWSPPVKDGFEDRVRLLRLLAPIIAELLEARSSARRTAEALTRVVAAEFVDPDEFKRRSASLIGKLLEQAARDGERPGERRLACVIFKAMPGDPPFTGDRVEWLGAQLSRLVPEAFLSAWKDLLPLHAKIERYVLGRLGKLEVALFLPVWLDAERVRLLRTLPSRFNQTPPALREDGKLAGRIGAWVVDFKDTELRPLEAQSDRIGALVLGRAQEAAHVLDDLVAGYQYHIKGEWDEALRRVEHALRRQPTNPYLLRRATEFSVTAGAVDSAVTFGKRAVEAAPRSVRAVCLCGDATLLNGDLTGALALYNQAMDISTTDALPYESKGYALAFMTRLVQLHILESARKSTGDDIRTLRRCAAITSTLEELMGAALELFMRAGEFRTDRAERRFQAPEHSYGLLQTRFLLGDADGAVREISAARKLAPWDQHLQREIVLARMWLRGCGEKFYQFLAEHDDIPALLKVANYRPD